MAITYNDDYISVLRANYGQPTAQTRPVAPPPPAPVEYNPNKIINAWGGILAQRGACGIGNMYDFKRIDLSTFQRSDAGHYERYYTKENTSKHAGGCGFLSVAFIDDDMCRDMYRQLKEWYPILYQSPIRFNVNSGNNFFFCIFDTGEKEMPKRFSDPNHEEFDEDHVAGFPNGLEW